MTIKNDWNIMPTLLYVIFISFIIGSFVSGAKDGIESNSEYNGCTTTKVEGITKRVCDLDLPTSDAGLYVWFEDSKDGK